MGLLDQVIGGVLGNVLGGGQGTSSGQSYGGGLGGGLGGGSGGGLGGALGNAASSPLVKALFLLLAAKAAHGGFGDILGSGPRGGTPDRGPAPSAPPQGGGLGSDNPFHHNASPPASGDTPYGDLSGYLDKPGGQAQAQTQGGMRDGSSLGSEPAGAGAGGALGGGLGSLIEGFQRNGYGDVINSWIGHGENRPVQPNHLGDALGQDTVDQLSHQTGMNRDDLLGQLSRALPGVIDKLTPQGRAPSGEELRHW